MKFSISSKELQTKLSIVSKVIQKKNTLAILDFAMVSCENERFFLTGASSNNQLTVPFDIRQTDSSKFSPFCIDASQFLAILGTLPEQPIEIEVDTSKNFATTVIYQGGDFKLSSQSAEHFPLHTPIKETTVAFALPSSVFIPCVKAAQTCTADDELRPQLASVALDVDAEGVTFVATDCHALYRYIYTHGVPFIKEGEPAMILVPRNLVSAIEAAIGKSEEVSIRTNGKKVEFVAGETVLLASTMEGKYPNYNTVIPQEVPYHAVLSVRDLAMAVKRVSIMANSATNMLVFTKKNGELSLSSTDYDFGRSATTILPCEDCTLPDGFKIGLKASQVSLLLGNIATDDVRMCFVAGNKPVLMKEVADNSVLTELLMPMSIENV